MKLYYSPGACSLAPHIVLEEIGNSYETKLVSTMDGSTGSNDYLKINSKGRVPVLDDGGTIITEASAIMIYLGLRNQSCNLILNTPISVARTVEWMNWLAGIHTFVIAQNWRTERFSDDLSAHKSIQKKGMENLNSIYRQIDAKLKGSEWALDNNYSIADPYLLVFFRWGNRLGLEMKEFPNWTKHAKKMEQRTAVKIVLEKEGISIWS